MLTRTLLPKLVTRAAIALQPGDLMTSVSNSTSDCLRAKRDARQRVKDRLKGLSEQDMAVESEFEARSEDAVPVTHIMRVPMLAAAWCTQSIEPDHALTVPCTVPVLSLYLSLD